MDRTTIENPDRDLLTSEQIESLTVPLARHEYQALCEDAVNALMFNYDGYLKLLEHDAALRSKLEAAEQRYRKLRMGIETLIIEADNIYARDKDGWGDEQARARGMLDMAHDLHRLLGSEKPAKPKRALDGLDF